MRSWKALATTTLASAVALIAAPAVAGEGQDRVTATITATPYAMKTFKDGADISERWPVKAIRYAKDGTALSTLANGKEVKSSWTLDADGKLLVINTPGVGESRWEVLEASTKIFRKRSLDNGVEAVQTPR
jgi:hypothetical protein